MAAGTFTVDDLGDGPDVNPGDGVCATAENVCTLRAAIVESNAMAGADTIAFNVAGTISPSSDLPTILQRTTIDGTTAPDYAGVPVVVLEGGEARSIGLNFGVTASASELIGVKIIGFAASGVNISASDMQVHHNYIGPVDGGTPNFDGIVVYGTDNQIGNGESEGNVISGNTNDGVVLNGSGHNLLANDIGSIGGEGALVDHPNVVCGNGDDSIDLQNASSVTIGGDASAVSNGAFENAAPAQDTPLEETIVVASTDFNAIEAALPPVKPAAPHRARTLRPAAGPTNVTSAPIVEPVRPRVAAAARPPSAEAAIAVSKPEPVPEKGQPWNVPAAPIAPRSRLGLLFLAAGTAFAAFLRMIR